MLEFKVVSCHSNVLHMWIEFMQVQMKLLDASIISPYIIKSSSNNIIDDIFLLQ